MSMTSTGKSLLLGVLGATVLVAGCERPPPDITQRGYPGLALQEVDNPRTERRLEARNQAPPSLPAASGGGPKAGTVYQNVKVLGDLDVASFTRLMASMTQWVSPEQGCTYCHADGNFASEEKYTKQVSRRMLQMTMYVNEEWTEHVAATGVTCYTCHRGQPVPAEIWFEDPGPRQAKGPAGNRAGQNAPSDKVAMASLPYDPFTTYLAGETEIRVQGATALPMSLDGPSIQATEGTYGLMMHLSEALGVNCTYCHNSRSFYAWDQSSPVRTTAWHGVRMARDLNGNFLVPLQDVYPDNRLGPLGDAPKANCATCHQGVAKPLYGAPMAKDYPELKGGG